jgi:hypothetical protein
MFQRFAQYLYYRRALAYAGNGMALLADNHVDVERMLDARTLNIASTDRCALGQCYGHYKKGVNALNIVSDEFAAQHGFRAHESFLTRTIGYAKALALLTKAWQEVLERTPKRALPA